MKRSGLPDIQWTHEDNVAGGDKVAARFTMHGTYQATFFRAPPTGKSIKVQPVSFYRFTNG